MSFDKLARRVLLLLGKLAKLVLIAFAFIGLLYLTVGQFLGPGVGDFEEHIINGYEYSYTGGYGRMIVYTGNERPRQIVIAPRVDGYRVDGDRLLVARRPVEGYMVGDVRKTRLLPTCEYWVIDVKTHRVEKTAESGGLRCSASVQPTTPIHPKSYR